MNKFVTNMSDEQREYFGDLFDDMTDQEVAEHFRHIIRKIKELQSAIEKQRKTILDVPEAEAGNAGMQPARNTATDE